VEDLSLEEVVRELEIAELVDCQIPGDARLDGAGERDQEDGGRRHEGGPHPEDPALSEARPGEAQSHRLGAGRVRRARPLGVVPVAAVRTVRPAAFRTSSVCSSHAGCIPGGMGGHQVA
jgi:hypothetical protein